MTLLDAPLIKRLREQHGWEQQELAAKAGIARSVISRLENGYQGDFKLSVAVAIASAFDVPIDSLLIPQHQKADPQFSTILQATLADLADQPARIQNHVAGMIRGYIDALNQEK